MMKNKKLVKIISIALAVVVITGAGVYAATTLGTQSDPLITLSYITDTLQPALLSAVGSEIDAAASQLEDAFNKALTEAGSVSVGTYKVVTLTSGQTLTGEIGCEIMLREGVAAASGSGLVNMSAGSGLSEGGQLTINNLCMVSAQGSGVSAASGAVKLLVRGTFTIA